MSRREPWWPQCERPGCKKANLKFEVRNGETWQRCPCCGAERPVGRKPAPPVFFAPKTHCPQGHELNASNTYRGECRPCNAERARDRRRRLREAGAA